MAGRLSRIKPLLVAAILGASSMLSAISPFVPSAAAAGIWEEIPLTYDGQTPVSSGIIPSGANLLIDSIQAKDLTVYSKYKISYSYKSVGAGLSNPSLDYYYQEIQQNANNVGDYIEFQSDDSIVNDGVVHDKVTEEFTITPSSPNYRLRLMPFNGNGGNSRMPEQYPNRLDLSNIKLLGYKDSTPTSPVVPAKPTITSPEFNESIPIDEIYDNVSPRRVSFTPDGNSPVVKSIIKIGGEFEGASGHQNVTLPQDVNGNFRNLKDFAPGTVGGLKYKTGNLYSIFIRSTTVANADENDATLWSEPSNEGYFYVSEGVPPLNTLPAPTNLMPADGSEVKDMFADFTWGMVAEATSYDVDISLDSGFVSLEKTYRNLPGGFSPDSQSQPFKFEPLKNHQDYYWRVRANDADGSSTWAVAHFTTNATNIGAGPVQIRPINGEILTTLGSVPLEFKNNMTENYTKTENEDYWFLLQASKTNDFSNIIMATIEPGTTSGQESILGNLQDNTTYYWRVMMFTKTKVTDWSTTSFTISTGQATSPTQIRPINGEIVTTARVLLEWENDPVANSIELGPDYDFLVEVSKVSDFSTTVQTDILDAFDSSVPIYGEVEDNTTYYWRVRIFTDTKSSDWSTTSFRVQLGDNPTEPTEPVTPNPNPTEPTPPVHPEGESIKVRPNDNTVLASTPQVVYQSVDEATPEAVESAEEVKTDTSSSEDKKDDNSEVKASETKGLAWYWWLIGAALAAGAVWRGLIFFRNRSDDEI